MSFGQWMRGGVPTFDIDVFLGKGRYHAGYRPYFRNKEFIYFDSGSHTICNPPPENSDIDYFVYFPEDKTEEEVEAYLRSAGLEICVGGDYPSEEFVSWRSGKYNIILLRDYTSYITKAWATIAARGLNLLRKEDRISLFDTFENAVHDAIDYRDSVAAQERQQGQRPIGFEWSVSTVNMPISLDTTPDQ